MVVRAHVVRAIERTTLSAFVEWGGRPIVFRRGGGVIRIGFERASERIDHRHDHQHCNDQCSGGFPESGEHATHRKHRINTPRRTQLQGSSAR